MEKLDNQDYFCSDPSLIKQSLEMCSFAVGFMFVANMKKKLSGVMRTFEPWVRECERERGCVYNHLKE